MLHIPEPVYLIELLHFAPSSLAAAGTNLLLDLKIHFDVQIPILVFLIWVSSIVNSMNHKTKQK